jgi:hypothetical protein
VGLEVRCAVRQTHGHGFNITHSFLSRLQKERTLATRYRLTCDEGLISEMNRKKIQEEVVVVYFKAVSLHWRTGHGSTSMARWPG